MARGKGRGRKGLQPEGLSDFAGGDADKETIEKLAEAAKKANAKGGDNSEPKDEVIERNFNAIELAWSEIDAAGRIMQKARSALSAALKTAKTDCGSKTWATNIEKAVKLKRQGDKGGNGELVTEHRQVGRILRLKGVPLGTQFQLFAVPEEDTNGAKVDATGQGEQAGREGVKREDNPFTPGGEDWFAWNNGWQVGQDSIAATLGRGNDVAEATH
jgi:hypothetical protein